MDNPIDGTSVKLGHGFSSAGGLKEMDLGPEDRPRQMYISAKSNPEYKPKLINLFEEI